MTTGVLISFGFVWLLVVVQAFVLLEVVRQLGSIEKRIPTNRPLVVGEASRIGDRLPHLSAVRANDRLPTSWESYLRAGLNVIVFATPRCTHCYAIAEDIARFHPRLSRAAGITVVLEGRIDDAERFITAVGLDRQIVAIDTAGETARRIGINFYPAALTTSDGRLGQAAIVNSIEQIEAVVERGILDMNELRSALAVAPRPGDRSVSSAAPESATVRER